MTMTTMMMSLMSTTNFDAISLYSLVYEWSTTVAIAIVVDPIDRNSSSIQSSTALYGPSLAIILLVISIIFYSLQTLKNILRKLGNSSCSSADISKGRRCRNHTQGASTHCGLHKFYDVAGTTPCQRQSAAPMAVIMDNRQHRT